MADERRSADQEQNKRISALEQGQATIMATLAVQAQRLEENTVATLRVEANTNPLVTLANQITSMGTLIAKTSEVLKAILKILLVLGITLGLLAAGVYALTHDGHLPGWFRDLLRIWRDIE